MNNSEESQATAVLQRLGLKKLTVEQIRQLDELLASLGDYGEVHFIVQHGELRYINKIESFKAWKNHVKTGLKS